MRVPFLLAAALALSQWHGAALPAPAGTDTPQYTPQYTPQCALGRAVLEEALAALHDDDQVIFDDAAVMHYYSNPAARPEPPSIPAWKAAGPSNLFIACPELRTLVRPPARFATDADRAEVRSIGRGRFLVVRSLTAPFMDPQGASGIILSIDRCPGLCGGSFLARYERRGRSWIRAEILQTVFS